jgi:hypothetical protein
MLSRPAHLRLTRLKGLSHLRPTTARGPTHLRLEIHNGLTRLRPTAFGESAHRSLATASRLAHLRPATASGSAIIRPATVGGPTHLGPTTVHGPTHLSLVGTKWADPCTCPLCFSTIRESTCLSVHAWPAKYPARGSICPSRHKYIKAQLVRAPLKPVIVLYMAFVTTHYFGPSRPIIIHCLLSMIASFGTSRSYHDRFTIGLYFRESLTCNYNR